MRRGGIWLVDFEPAQGSAGARQRPAIIVSNNGANAAATRSTSGVVTVVPLTTNITKVYDFQALLDADESGLRESSKAQAEQARSVSVRRLLRLLSHVPASSMRRVDDALRVHLEL